MGPWSLQGLGQERNGGGQQLEVVAPLGLRSCWEKGGQEHGSPDKGGRAGRESQKKTRVKGAGAKWQSLSTWEEALKGCEVGRREASCCKLTPRKAGGSINGGC